MPDLNRIESKIPLAHKNIIHQLLIRVRDKIQTFTVATASFETEVKIWRQDILPLRHFG